ncbi:hypothetical protein J6590_083322 [Homalodisca vitripennis]|nr:hypothetical protein J6590_083322 [Homalodisca vitripennis]
MSEVLLSALSHFPPCLLPILDSILPKQWPSTFAYYDTIVKLDLGNWEAKDLLGFVARKVLATQHRCRRITAGFNLMHIQGVAELLSLSSEVLKWP